MSDNHVTRQGFRKPVSKSVLLGVTLAVSVMIAAVMSAVGYRLGWWRHLEALSIFEWATYAATIALIVSAYGSFKTRPKSQQRGLLLGITGMALSLPVITATLLFEYSAQAFPPINDITTDTQDPPSFWDMPNPIEYPGQAVADIQQAAYPDLTPLELSIRPETAFEYALAVVADRGWEILASDPDEGHIEATDSSLLFGFKDEVVVRITASGEGTIVDVRSRSRIGRIDRGSNARRIRGYLKILKERVATL